MRFRRSIASFAGICVLSLTLGRTTSACENTNRNIHTAASATSEHGGSHPLTPVDGQQQKPCKSSAVACCQAMASCGLSVQSARTVTTDDFLSGRCDLPPVRFQAVPSRITPPEPPPPKA